MTQIIRFLFVYPAFLIAKHIIKKFTLAVTLAFVVSILIFSSNYISTKLPGILWDMSGNVEQEVTEAQVVEIVVKKGNTLSSILSGQDLPRNDLQQLLQLAKTIREATNLKIGQVISFYYETELLEQTESDLVEERLSLNRMSIKVDNIKSIEFVRQNNQFVAHEIAAPLKKVITRYQATIDSNLISALKKAGMTTRSVIKLINTYSHQIDLQRQIRSGDTITVIAEKFITPDNQLSHHGKILYSSLTSKGQEYKIYLYSPSGQAQDLKFFSENGQTIKSTLLRTPIDVVRISSHFGYRKKHPVLGYGRMHKGVDFAASTGTPIYSAGKGIIQFIGWKSGYGRFIIVKHNNDLSTAYAHASKFAKNLKKGSKVKQGQIIAYVGSSGHATGPHLHYEVRIKGSQVNPLKFKSTPDTKLTGKNLAQFNKIKTRLVEIDQELAQEPDYTAEINFTPLS
ncbi:MAG: peptidoglycan DD-metalloendopeptidase family protein [Rickettsiaceae bacterium]